MHDHDVDVLPSGTIARYENALRLTWVMRLQGTYHSVHTWGMPMLKGYGLTERRGKEREGKGARK